VPNRTTRALKEAILAAAGEVGEDGEGKGGLQGYLKRIAVQHPKEFVSLLGRVLPLQMVTEPEEPREHRSAEEIRAELRRRDLPDHLFLPSPSPDDEVIEAEYRRIPNGSAEL